MTGKRNGTVVAADFEVGARRRRWCKHACVQGAGSWHACMHPPNPVGGREARRAPPLACMAPPAHRVLNGTVADVY